MRSLSLEASHDVPLRRVMGFDHAVANVIAELRKGEVVSYGWVASAAGYPGAARAVGRFLADYGHGLPWWRVVRADGRLVAPEATPQAEALRAEGVNVIEGRVRQPLPRVP